MKKKRLFYVSHPYGGNPENEKAVQDIIDEMSGRKLRPNSFIFMPFGDDSKFVSPIHILGPLYDAIPYIDGLDLCLSLLRRCDGIILCGDWQHSSRKESAPGPFSVGSAVAQWKCAPGYGTAPPDG